MDEPVCVEGEWSDLANLTYLVNFARPEDALADQINDQTNYLATQVERLRAEVAELRKSADPVDAFGGGLGG